MVTKTPLFIGYLKSLAGGGERQKPTVSRTLSPPPARAFRLLRQRIGRKYPSKNGVFEDHGCTGD
jgi:hypothetical protein